MKKAIVGFFVVAAISILAMNNTDAYAGDCFEQGIFTYEIVKPAEDSNDGEVTIVDIRSDVRGSGSTFNIAGENIIIPAQIENQGKKYDVTRVSVVKKINGTGITTNRLVFENVKYIEFPESLKNIDAVSIWFTGCAPEIVFKCSYQAAKEVGRFGFDESSAGGAIIYAPSEELSLYQEKFEKDAVFSVGSASDLGEREIYGFYVYPLGTKGCQPRYFYNSDGNGATYYDSTAKYAAYFEVKDRDAHIVKCIDYQMRDMARDDDILYLPATAYYSGTQYMVKTLTRFSTIGLGRPLVVPEGITELEDESIGGDIIALYLPDSLKKLPRKFFCGDNRMLRYIKLPKGLKSIPSKLFAECRYLRSIKIPKKVKYIGSKTFSKNMKDIYLECACPQNLVKALSKMKKGNLYVRPEHILGYEECLNGNLSSKKYSLNECGFSLVDQLALNRTSLDISEHPSFRFKAVVGNKGSDYRIVWAVSFPQNGMDISDKGRLSSGPTPSAKKVYAFEVLSGKMAVCQLFR